MANGQPQNPGAALNWAGAPRMDSRDFHDVGGQEWRYDETGVFLRNNPQQPLRTANAPATVNAILAIYGTEIFSASMTRQIPPELIVMTIAVETAIFRNVGFTGPKTFRWEQGVTSYSGGPMQILETTARDVISALHLVFEPQQVSKCTDLIVLPALTGERRVSVGASYLGVLLGGFVVALGVLMAALLVIMSTSEMREVQRRQSETARIALSLSIKSPTLIPTSNPAKTSARLFWFPDPRMA